MTSIGIIGYGAIGAGVADHLLNREIKGCELSVILTRCQSLSHLPMGRSDGRVRVVTTIEEFMEESLDLVVEAASQSAVRQYLPLLLDRGIHVLVMSVGAFADREFYDKCVGLAERKGTKVMIPSGGIAGLDAIKAASIAGISSLVLRTSKPPQSLRNATSNTKGRGDKIRPSERELTFRGSPAEAARLYPQNVNVAVSLGLAGNMLDKMVVEVYADSSVSRNVHEVHASGAFGTLLLKLENVPSPENPRTSYIAILSAIRKIADLSSPVSLGT